MSKSESEHTLAMYPTVEIQEENPFSKLVGDQTIVEVPEFTLECGEKITRVPVAYKTWGKLNEAGSNCMLITHALAGSADVGDWWGPLLGRGKAFDPTKWFIICFNAIGSPYGTVSPVTTDWMETGERYGPEFPLCTIRDDVRLHRLVLESLGVHTVAICIGGSMGGMLTLEWMFEKDAEGGNYVKNVVALATSARHSAWCISWGEAQRQCIYSDPKYKAGYYPLSDPPSSGLGAARMAALLTYRSRNSFESRFGREAPSRRQQLKSMSNRKDALVDEESAVDDNTSVREENWLIHNEGSAKKGSFEEYHSRSNSTASLVEPTSPSTRPPSSIRSPSVSSVSSMTSLTSTSSRRRHIPRHYFSAQSYLRYQANKFIGRFDANCYICITRKLDTHDLGRDRPEYDNDSGKALESRTQPSLVIGISSDALFTLSEQIFIAKHLQHSTLKKLNSNEGHDAFLLEFEEINQLILDFEKLNVAEIMDAQGNNEDWDESKINDGKKESVFGEAEDVASW